MKHCLVSPTSWMYRPIKAGHTHLLECWFQLLPVMVLLHLLETQNLEGRQRPHLLHKYLLVTVFWEGRKWKSALTHQPSKQKCHQCNSVIYFLGHISLSFSFLVVR